VGQRNVRAAALLLLSLPGPAFLFQGDEIGMADGPGRGADAEPDDRHGRDPYRHPLVWDATPGAGFTTGTPWLPIADEHLPLAVREQVGDAGSLHAFYVDWLGWHRRERLLRDGTLQLLAPTDQVLAFERVAGGESLICVFNLSGEPAGYRIDRDAVAMAERSIGARLEGGEVRLERCGMLFARVGAER
jgi:alpha-glucosidase